MIQNVSDWEKQTYFKHIKIYETLSYAGFSFSGEVTVEVTKMDPERPGMPNRPWIRSPGQPATAMIRPERFGIKSRSRKKQRVSPSIVPANTRSNSSTAIWMLSEPRATP